MDPTTMMTLIGTVLGLVDKFYDVSKKLKGERVEPHSVEVKPDKDKLVIVDHGHVQEIAASELQLSEFDQVRHDTLYEKIKINWKIYNKLDVQTTSAAADEKIRLKLKMDETKKELCPDFLELVRMYEKVLGRSLPDHYSLYDVCN